MRERGPIRNGICLPDVFFRTTYVGQVLAKETGIEPSTEEATRMGDLALLWFSIGESHRSAMA